ncbi:MAG: hypothetical protein ACYS0D_15180, partial [Planctomycetota bacterium]
GFEHRQARITRKRDNARVEGTYLGESVTVEADFDHTGKMIEFEAESWCGSRKLGLAALEDLPEPATREIERVLGDTLIRLERPIVTRGSAGKETHYKIRGTVDGWKWEIGVSESGRLLEVEKETSRHQGAVRREAA